MSAAEILSENIIWLRSKASRENVKFWGQSLSQGHYGMPENGLFIL